MKKIIKWFKTNFKKEKIHGMTVIRNKFFPFPGYKAINLFGIMFVRGNARIDDLTLNHEKIHTAQMKEMFYIFFYVWYVIEWLIHLGRFKDRRLAYRRISFEREAYTYDNDIEYLKNRKWFTFLQFIG